MNGLVDGDFLPLIVCHPGLLLDSMPEADCQRLWCEWDPGCVQDLSAALRRAQVAIYRRLLGESLARFTALLGAELESAARDPDWPVEECFALVAIAMVGLGAVEARTRLQPWVDGAGTSVFGAGIEVQAAAGVEPSFDFDGWDGQLRDFAAGMSSTAERDRAIDLFVDMQEQRRLMRDLRADGLAIEEPEGFHRALLRLSMLAGRAYETREAGILQRFVDCAGLRMPGRWIGRGYYRADIGELARWAVRELEAIGALEI
ncbi:MAG: hypothetical protein JXR96_15415 [Deltaproteobacteria bacterium]|nr:hypothetical protein [Deltaproteobacteria bacterium]